ncbi:MAG: queuosine precursor transporter [Rhodothermaceae bacterium]
MVAFVVVLLCSNIIGAAKVTTIQGFTFGAGILFFPISYLFGDVLTEVYGYARSRKVIWAGFAALLFASFMSWFIVNIPPADGWDQQEIYATVFGQTPRIALASFIAYWSGEFTNSYIMAKMKIFSKGRFLWMRTIGSTIGGEAVDSLIFYPVAFWGVWPDDLVISVMIANYLLKTGWEVILTPVTYKIVKFLKKAESEDYYDTETNFSPFKVEI